MKKIIAILGPTSVGKSACAIHLAQELKTEIINFDSQQVYRDMNIGTGKTPLAERLVPHHLIDILKPNETMNAQRFADEADRCIEALHKKQSCPILVGGTGLYLRALLYGLDKLPAADPKIREQLTKRAQEKGLTVLHQDLKEKDPLSATKIHPNDSSRIIRALEVIAMTGKTLSEHYSQSGPPRYDAYLIALEIPREILRKKIAQRVQMMIEEGWLDEVQKLIAQKNVSPDDLKNAIGYKEMYQVVEGNLSLQEAQKQITQATCQYAKRQMTWFRKEKNMHWYTATDKNIFSQIQNDLEDFLNEHS